MHSLRQTLLSQDGNEISNETESYDILIFLDDDEASYNHKLLNVPGHG